MAETIRGGATRNPDGSWINANGERIAAPNGSVYVRPESPAVVTDEQVTPGSGALDEYATPEDELEEGNPSKTRRVTKKKS